MCGIIYAHNFDGSPVNNDVLDQFDAQRHRGTDGFGIYDGQEMNMMHATREDAALKWLVRYDSNLLLMHHRWPTSTANTKRAAHPFSTKDFFGDTEYILVHNGVIHNANKLVDKHAEKGVVYQSWVKQGNALKFNDSEALLWDFALHQETGSGMEAVGDIAFIVLKKVKGKLDKLFYYRNYGRPLKLYADEVHIRLSSEGKGEDVPVHKLHTWDYTTHQSWTTSLTLAPDNYVYDFSESYFGYSRGLDGVWRPRSSVPADVEAKAMEYIAAANGLFEEAYWAVEWDYDMLFEQPQDEFTSREQALLEGVMEYIENDPENHGPNSVSSLFLPITSFRANTSIHTTTELLAYA